MDRPRRPVLVAQLGAGPRIEVELDRVAVVRLRQRGMVGLLQVEAAQANVERLVVPHVEKLRGAVLDVAVIILHRRAEGIRPLAEPAVHDHLASATASPTRGRPAPGERASSAEAGSAAPEPEPQEWRNRARSQATHRCMPCLFERRGLGTCRPAHDATAGPGRSQASRRRDSRAARTLGRHSIA